MTAEEIMHVLRLVAMGRVNHPDQQVFCEKLAALMSPPAPAPQPREPAPPVKVKIEEQPSPKPKKVR
jgi:hypothetical protein